MAQSALLNVMTQAARWAGRSLSRDFGEVQSLQVSINGPQEYVAKARRTAVKKVRENLEKARPEFGLLIGGLDELIGREKQNRWLVDPLNGEVNFSHGIPHFCVSVALEREGRIIAGVLYNPVLDNLYTCERGVGAFLNDRRMRVANRKELSDCLVDFCVPKNTKRQNENHLKQIAALMAETSELRNSGCSALGLANVANGSADGFWKNGVELWQVAAALLLVREAGGFVSDIEGDQGFFDTDTIAAGNMRIQQQLVSAIKTAG